MCSWRWIAIRQVWHVESFCQRAGDPSVMLLSVFPHLWFELHLRTDGWIVVEALHATKAYFPPVEARKVYLSRWLCWYKCPTWTNGAQRCSRNWKTCPRARNGFLFVMGAEGFKLRLLSADKARVDPSCCPCRADGGCSSPSCSVLRCYDTAWNSPSQPKNLLPYGGFLGPISIFIES